MVYWIEASNVERKPHTTSARESRVLRCPEMARVLHVLQQFPHNYRTQLMKTFQDSQVKIWHDIRMLLNIIYM